MKEKFPERLKRLRESKGLSLSNLAKNSDLSENNIVLLELDSRQVPTWITVSKLASALGCNPFYLASGDGDHKPFRIRQEYWVDVTSISIRSR